jgi:hypothetical protein
MVVNFRSEMSFLLAAQNARWRKAVGRNCIALSRPMIGHCFSDTLRDKIGASAMPKLFCTVVIMAISFATTTSALASMPAELGEAGDAINPIQSGVVAVDWRDQYPYVRRYHHPFFLGPFNDFQPNYKSNNYNAYHRQFYGRPGINFQFGF